MCGLHGELMSWLGAVGIVKGEDKFGAESGESAPQYFQKITCPVYDDSDTIQSET